NNIATILNQLLTLVGALAIVIALNWRMTLFILLLAPPMGLIAALFGRKIRDVSTDVQDELADSSTVVEELLQYVRVGKSFGREDFAIARDRDTVRRTFAAAMRLTRVRAIFSPLITSLIFLAVVGVLWFGGREVIAGRLTAGGLTSFLF